MGGPGGLPCLGCEIRRVGAAGWTEKASPGKYFDCVVNHTLNLSGKTCSATRNPGWFIVRLVIPLGT